jgi:hypothetical protein
MEKIHLLFEHPRKKAVKLYKNRHGCHNTIQIRNKASFQMLLKDVSEIVSLWNIQLNIHYSRTRVERIKILQEAEFPCFKHLPFRNSLFLFTFFLFLLLFLSRFFYILNDFTTWKYYSWKPECVLSFNMGWQIFVNFIPRLWLGIKNLISANPCENSKHILASIQIQIPKYFWHMYYSITKLFKKKL